MKKKVSFYITVLLCLLLTACSFDTDKLEENLDEEYEKMVEADKQRDENSSLFEKQDEDTSTEQTDDLLNKDDFESANYDDYGDYYPGDFETPYIFVEGEITEVWDYGIVICDNDEHLWEVSTLLDLYDFSGYLNTRCEVYGKVEYIAPENSASPVPNIPSIGLFENESCCIIFHDGKVLYDYVGAENEGFPLLPKDAELNSDEENTSEETIQDEKDNDTESVTVPEPETGEDLVWVPVNGGTKYHSYKGCSNMEDPIQVTKETAEANGYTPCKRCH